MSALRFSSSLTLACLVCACGARHPGGGDKAPQNLQLVLKPWSLVGQQAYPGDEVAVQVVALKSAGADIQDSSGLVPAVGEAIAWRLLGSPPGSPSLSANSTATDAQGLSFITVDVGSRENASVQVEAAATGADPVTFTIQVRADQRRLELMVPAVLSTAVNRTERLRVRLLRVMPNGTDGPPVSGAELEVELKGGVSASGARLEPGTSDTVAVPGALVSITTDGTGIGSIRFSTGSTPQPTGYTIEFCGGGACQGVQATSVSVRVTNGVGGSQCQYFTDCEPGYVCDNGTCKPASNYCETDTDCPTGYHCPPATEPSRTCTLNTCAQVCHQNSECNTATQICGSGLCCIPADGCLSSDDCPSGWSCDAQSGACRPPSSTAAMDVRGLWYTTYHFDISSTLPAFFVNGLGPVVDFLSLVFASQLQIDIPVLGDILEAVIAELVAQYVPPWVRTLVSVLADFIHLFQNMEAEGDMLLTQTPAGPPLGSDVQGVEDWVSARFFAPSFCAGGPAEFAADPSCGEIDVVVDPTVDVATSDDPLRLGVAVDPFLGEVMGNALRLNGRNVRFRMAQLVNAVLDTVTLMASNGSYSDFETFLADIIPCYDLQQAIDDLMCDATGGDVCSVPGIEAICEAAAAAAANALGEALAQIEFQIFEVEFDQRALIHDVPLGGAADIFGDPLDPADNGESALVGTTGFTFFGGELDANSWWYGIRAY